MHNKIFEVQKQIRENQLSLTEYMRDLSNWERDISDKDKFLSKESSTYQSKSIDITKESRQEKEKDKIEKQNFESKNKKIKDELKRDGTSLKTYYDTWNKFSVDEELAIIENSEKEDIEKVIIKPTSLFSKTGNSAQNTAINVIGLGSRNRSTYTADQLKNLKRDGTTYFKMKNYNKAIELFTQGINQEQLNDEYLISFLNNRGNSYLKLELFKEALKDFEWSYRINNAQVKVIYRLSFCYYKLRQFDFSLRLVGIALGCELSKDEKDLFELLRVDNISQLEIGITQSYQEMKKVYYVDDEEDPSDVIVIKEVDLKDDISDTGDNLNISLRDSKLTTKISILHDKNNNENKDNSNLNNCNQDNNTKSFNEEEKNNDSCNSNNISSNKIKHVINDEELVKFVESLVSENITSSSLKLAFSNLQGKEKIELRLRVLLKLSPSNLGKVFKNDLDKNVLKEFLDCFDYCLPEKQAEIIEYLRQLTKVSRFSLIVKFIDKKCKF